MSFASDRGELFDIEDRKFVGRGTATKIRRRLVRMSVPSEYDEPETFRSVTWRAGQRPRTARPYPDQANPLPEPPTNSTSSTKMMQAVAYRSKRLRKVAEIFHDPR